MLANQASHQLDFELGHSHIPFICRPAEEGAVFVEFPMDTVMTLGTDRFIINPGSVGQPRDGDPRASYAVYDSESNSVMHHRVEYDIAVTQARMEGLGLPKFLISRLAEGK